MKVFLNGEEFYYRLRDLLESNDDLNSYKFNNKYHAITKDFDAFLQTTVRKYVDAYNKLPLVKEEKEELLLENTVLKEKVNSLSLILSEKDTIIRGIELLVKEKDQLISQLELGQRDKGRGSEGQKEGGRGVGGLGKAEEREGLWVQIQEAKAECSKYAQQITRLMGELENVKAEKEVSLQRLMGQCRRELEKAMEALQEEHRKEIKALKFLNEEKISSLNDQVWYLEKKCEEWRQKYKEELGFNVLAESQ